MYYKITAIYGPMETDEDGYIPVDETLQCEGMEWVLHHVGAYLEDPNIVDVHITKVKEGS